MRIVYIDIDSLRPDHLGCYGYHRRSSPNIDQIADEGVRFTNFYCSDSPCLPSRTAFFTGRFGINSGIVNHGGVYADRRPEGPGRQFRNRFAEGNLAGVLRAAGYRTASISPFPQRHSAYHVWENFHEMIDTGTQGHEHAEVGYSFAETWLQQNHQRDNWFLHVNFWDPHGPYDVPLSYGNPFENDPPPDWLTQELIDRQRKTQYGSFDALRPSGRPLHVRLKDVCPRQPETISNRAEWKQWIDGYDVGIHYADAHVGKIIARLIELGIYNDTAIIVSSDHGENHGELGIYGDHQTADHWGNYIPLIVRWPGLDGFQPGSACDSLLYNVDLTATLAELCGGSQPALWDGRSFAGALKSGVNCGREFLVLSQGASSCQRSVRWGDHVLVRTYHTGNNNFPTWMLFNLKDDPHELNNLAGMLPDLVGHGAVLMEGWMYEQMLKSGAPDPLMRIVAEGGPYHARENFKKICERLRRHGRDADAEWLEKNGGRPRDEAR